MDIEINIIFMFAMKVSQNGVQKNSERVKLIPL